MASIEQHVTPEEMKRSEQYVETGSVFEALTGAGTATLAILGLAGVLPGYFAAIATIAVGVGLLSEGAAIVARYNDLLWEAETAHLEHRSLGSGMAAESVGGVAGVVLGILALVGVAPAVLLPVAAIVFGAALLIGSGANRDLNRYASGPWSGAQPHKLARQAATAATGGQALVGVGAMALGVLAVIGLSPVVLTLVALLSIGGATLMSGTALTARVRPNERS